MEFQDDYPLNLTRSELVNALTFLNKKINETLYDGEKTDLFWKIRLGQNQLLFLSIQENNQEFINQKKMLEDSIKDNRVTSKINKSLTYIIIVLTFITLLVQVIPFIRTDDEKEIKETLLKTNFIVEKNLHEVQKIRVKFDSIEKIAGKDNSRQISNLNK